MSLAEAKERRTEEAVSATSKLRAIAGRAEELKAELATARADAADKGRQLVEHRDEVCTYVRACVPSAREWLLSCWSMR